MAEIQFITPDTINASNFNPAAVNPAAGVSGYNKKEDIEQQASNLSQKLTAIPDASSASVMNLTSEELENFANYDVRLINDKAEMEKRRAENQSNWEKLRNSVAQTVVGEIGIGTVEAFANIFDMISSAVFDKSFYNGELSNKMSEIREAFDEKVPIYRDENLDISNGGLADFGWWASNIPTIASSLTLLIPSKAVTFGLGKAANLIGKAGKVTKTSKLAKLANEINTAGKVTEATQMSKAKETMNLLAAKANKLKSLTELTPLQKAKATYWGNQIATAAVSRTLENYQEGRQVHQDTYDSTLDLLNKMSDEERNNFIASRPQYENKTNEEIADDIATSAANKTFLQNYANVIFDIMELHAANKMFAAITNRPFGAEISQLNKQAIKNFGKTSTEISEKLNNSWQQKTYNQLALRGKQFLGVSKEGLMSQWSEAVEEAVNYVNSEEGKYYGKYLAGTIKDFSFGERMMEYFKNPQLYESAFWGYFGGIVFNAGYKGIQAIDKKIHTSSLNKKISNLKSDIASGKVDKKEGEKKLSILEQELNRYNFDVDMKAKEEIAGRQDKWNAYRGRIDMINNGINPYLSTRDELSKIEYDVEMEAAKARAAEEFINSLVKDSAEAGTKDMLKSWLEDSNVKQAFINAGITTTEEIDNFIPEIVNRIDEIGKLHDDAIYQLDKLGIEPNIARILADDDVERRLQLRALNRQKAVAESRIGDIRSRLAENPNDVAEFDEWLDISRAMDLINHIRRIDRRILELKQENTFSAKLELEYYNKLKTEIEQAYAAVSSKLTGDAIDVLTQEKNRVVIGFDETLNEYTFDTEADDRFIEEKAKELESYSKSEQGKLDAIKATKTAFDVKQERLVDRYQQLNKKFESNNDVKISLVTSEAEMIESKSRLLTNDEDIKKRARYLEFQLKSAAEKTVNDANETIGKIYEKYNDDEVFDYIDASYNSSTNDKTIKGITESDKKELDTAISLLRNASDEFSVQTINQLNSDNYNKSRRFKVRSAETKVNGEAAQVNVDDVVKNNDTDQEEQKDDKTKDQGDSSTGESKSSDTTEIPSTSPNEVAATIAKGSEQNTENPNNAANAVETTNDAAANNAEDNNAEKSVSYKPIDEGDDILHDDVTNSVAIYFAGLGKPTDEITDADFDAILSQVINDYSNRDSEKVKRYADAQIKQFKDLISAYKSKNNIKSIASSLSINSVLLAVDEQSKFNIGEKFKDSLKQFLQAYVNSAGIVETDGKYYINLQDVFRFYNNSDNGMNPIIQAMFDSVCSIFAETSSFENFVITDKSTLGSEQMLNNVFKTEEELLKERNERLTAFRLEIDQVKQDDDWKRMIDSLNPGDKLRHAFKTTERGTTYISVAKYDNQSKQWIELGRIWPAVYNGTTGTYTQTNKGFVYNVGYNNGKISSPMGDFLKEVFIKKDGWQAELRALFLKFGNRQYADINEANAILKRAEEILTDNATNLMSVGKIKNKPYFTTEDRLYHLCNVYNYVMQNENLGHLNKNIRLSIDAWLERLFNSYQNVKQLGINNKELVVEKINDGELIRADVIGTRNGTPIYQKSLPSDSVDENGNKVEGCIADIDNASIGASVPRSDNAVRFTGETNPIRITHAKYKFGNRFVAVKNKNGRVFYYNAFPRPAISGADVVYEKDGEKISLVEQIAQTIIDTIKTRYISESTGFDTYDSIISTLTDIFGKNGSYSSLFLGFDVIEGKDNNNQPYVYLKVSDEQNAGIIIYKSSRIKGFGGVKILNGLDSKVLTSSKILNESELDDFIKNLIKTRLLFSINEGVINLDNSAPLTKNGITYKTKDGKFRVKVGKFDVTYPSYKDFVLRNNLVEITGKKENGSNFKRPSETQMDRDAIQVKVVDIESSPVEESPINSVDPTKQSSIVPNDMAIALKEEADARGTALYNSIFEYIAKLEPDVNKRKTLLKHYENMLKSLENLGLSHGNIIFDENLRANAEYRPSSDVIVLGATFFLYFDNASDLYNPDDAIRVLVHENLHRLIYLNNKRKDITKKLKQVYDEFAALSDDKILEVMKETDTYKELMSNDKVDKSKIPAKYLEFIKSFKFAKYDEYKGDKAYEEFLVESITSYQFADFLNHVQSTNTRQDKKSLFNKILDFLKELFGIKINKGSLLEKNVNTILRALKDIDIIKTKTSNNENVFKEQPVVSKPVKVKTELDDDMLPSSDTSKNQTYDDTNEFEDNTFNDDDDIFGDSFGSDPDDAGLFGNDIRSTINSPFRVRSIPQIIERTTLQIKPVLRSAINQGELGISCKMS